MRCPSDAKEGVAAFFEKTSAGMAGEINNALNLKKETCEITVRCLSTQSLETFSSVPGQFETIMQMTSRR